MKINNLTKNKNGSYELLIDEEKINLDEDTIKN